MCVCVCVLSNRTDTSCLPVLYLISSSLHIDHMTLGWNEFRNTPNASQVNVIVLLITLFTPLKMAPVLAESTGKIYGIFLNLCHLKIK